MSSATAKSSGGPSVPAEARSAPGTPLRFNPKPDEVRRSVLKLVLTLVELIRRLMENQAVRRMECGTLTPDEIERVGLCLKRLEQTLVELAEEFEIPLEELNLELGPLGRLI